MTLGSALLEPLLSPASRTFLPFWLGSFVVVALLGLCGRLPGGIRQSLRAFRSPSARLDLQLLLSRQILVSLGWFPRLVGSAWLSWWAVTRLVMLADRLYVPSLEVPAPLVAGLYSLVLFVAWDASRYVVHRAMHRFPLLWRFHQVHHSAEHLTPLTFHRVHPLESLAYQVRGLLVTVAVASAFYWLFRDQAVAVGLFGVTAIGWLLNLAFGNLRHSHIWLTFGRWERWLLSPAQHQLHHGYGTDHVNFGSWLAVWDRLGGTFEHATTPPSRFGIESPNHGHDLLSAWFGPFRGLFRRPRRLAVVLALLTAGTARAEPDEDPQDEEWGEEIVVYQPDGTPRVAGSAHLVDEEELERFEYDDVGRVLGAVPGVYIRDEEGFGLRPNIGIRGASSERSSKITLLEDGIPLAPAPYAAPAAYYFPMVGRATGIEVFKGPAATRHGPQTVGGAINLLTRGVPEGITGAFDLAHGLRQTTRLHTWVGIGEEGTGLVAELVHLQSAGFKHLDGGGPTGFQRTEAMLSGTLSRGAHTVRLKLVGTLEHSNETYLGLHRDDLAADPDRRYLASAQGDMQWWRTAADLSWRAKLAPGLDLRTVAYHHRLDRAWRKLNRFRRGPDLHTLLQAPDSGQGAVFLAVLRGEEDTVAPEQALMIGTNDRQFSSFGVGSTLRWRTGSTVRHELEAGIRLHGDVVDRLHTEEPHLVRQGRLVAESDEVLVNLDSRGTALAAAAHVHDDIGLGLVHVLPGLRLEAVRTTYVHRDGSAQEALRSTLLPGVGTLVHAHPDVQVFGGVHRGFSPVAPGQPADVRPEISWNSEAGLRLTPGESALELVGFVADYVNLTGSCTFSGGCAGDQLDRQYNGGKVWIRGLEANATHIVRTPSDITVPIRASYTLTHTRFRTGFVSGFPQFGTVQPGDQLPYVPLHQGSLRVAIESGRASLSLGSTLRSGMRDAAGSGPLTEDDVPALLLLDASARLQVAERLRLTVDATNLTNNRAVTSWRPFGARPAAPFQVMFGAEYRP